ncbi:hypothetical protein TTRE_0000784401 [Trichuris trichiura]|uniref:Uncharacterized protein n=1 Tax=Trichuris trichiura TaxID=36087 RepID=A0A077ZI77_TRITR|nr:hypothetical protein TTRE_0000784401 [Trichuris trichiura]
MRHSRQTLKRTGLVVLAGLNCTIHSQALSHHCNDAGTFACCVSALGQFRLSLTNLVAVNSLAVTILTPLLMRTLGLREVGRSRPPGLKLSTAPSLRVAGLQASATTPDDNRFIKLGQK